MTDHLDALRLFARVARRGSFSAAGRELGVPQSTASRTIAALERDIGASLLVRSTRAVILTDVGADFRPGSSRFWPISTKRSSGARLRRAAGAVASGVGSSLAVRLVIPRLKPSFDRHAALQVELMLDDRRQDLVTEGVDVALRFGTLADSSATLIKLKTWPCALVAAPTIWRPRHR